MNLLQETTFESKMLLQIISPVFILLLIGFIVKMTRTPTSNDKSKSKKPISVNYHITRVCNYSCKFCFHTNTNSHVEKLVDAKRGLKLLQEAGMQKINFAGGEPFLEPKLLGELCKYSKETLNVAVSIVSNGSKINNNWMKKYGKYVDILAISCDSFNEETNIKIGRGNGNHLQNLENVSNICKEFNIRFKINSVINIWNWDEDMRENILQLNPMRWKVFQVLIIEGENNGEEESKRDARNLVITKEQFKSFCDKHKEIKSFVPEGNEEMRSSYLLLDEKMRFLDCSGNKKIPSKSILEVGVFKALEESGFDEDMFHKRGGVYDYVDENKKNSESGCGSSGGVITDIEDL